MKNKIVIILLANLLFSCSKQNSIEKIFNTGEDESWAYYDQLDPEFGFLYFNFYSDGTYDRFLGTEEFNKDGDLIYDYRTWSVSSDSIMNWGGDKYDIINYNGKVIVLSDPNKLGRYKFLIKEKKGHFRKGEGYYSKKNRNHPEKYLSNFK
jgi:hypothetical protein